MTAIAIILTLIGIIILITKAYQSRPQYILTSQKTQQRAGCGYDPLELAYTCRYLKEIRAKTPDETYQEIMNEYAQNTLRMLKNQLNKVLFVETDRLKTLEELDQFKLKHQFLYNEMDVLFPRKSITCFKDYEAYFPNFFLKERKQRLAEIKRITDGMEDPLAILTFMHKHISFSEKRGPFPYFTNDKDEPIPMEIIKRTDKLLLKTAEEANDINTFFQVLANMHDGEHLAAAAQHFVDFLKQEKDKTDNWDQYLENVEKNMKKINESSTALHFCAALKLYMAKEKSSPEKQKQLS